MAPVVRSKAGTESRFGRTVIVGMRAGVLKARRKGTKTWQEKKNRNKTGKNKRLKKYGFFRGIRERNGRVRGARVLSARGNDARAEAVDDGRRLGRESARRREGRQDGRARRSSAGKARAQPGQRTGGRQKGRSRVPVTTAPGGRLLCDEVTDGVGKGRGVQLLRRVPSQEFPVTPPPLRTGRSDA